MTSSSRESMLTPSNKEYTETKRDTEQLRRRLTSLSNEESLFWALPSHLPPVDLSHQGSAAVFWLHSGHRHSQWGQERSLSPLGYLLISLASSDPTEVPAMDQCSF